MQITGSVDFAASRTLVWTYIATPENVSACTPSLETWRTLEPGRVYELLLTRPLNGRHRMAIPVTVEWHHIAPPNQLHIRFAAQVGSRLINARGKMNLASDGDADAATTLNFVLEIDTDNSMVTQMVSNLAPRFIDNFFTCLKARLEVVQPAESLSLNGGRSDSL